MRRIDDDQGAVAVIVGVLMVALLGFTAIVVDVGAVYSERRQLQNGADAGALAVAQDCAVGAVACGDALATAEEFAELNDNINNDENASAEVPELLANSVTVRTYETVEHWFAPILGHDQSEIDAEATAVWGSPAGGPAILPIAFGRCVFDPSGATQWITYQTTNPTQCVPPMGALPGAFAWLQTPDGSTCGAYIEPDSETQGAPGNSFPGQCEDELPALQNEIVLIPIFTDSGGTGSGVWYGIDGFAAFRLTGYRFGGTPNLNWQNTGPGGCTGNCRGVRGHFEEFVSLEDFELGGPSYGAVIIKLTL